MKKAITLKGTFILLGLTFFSIMPVFAGTWRDDFEDNKTNEWEIYNEDKQLEKWWINDGEAVGEIFSPPFSSIWLTGDIEWEFYSVSCRVMLEEDRNELSSIALNLHDRGAERSRYIFIIDYVVNTARIIKGVPGGGQREIEFVAEKGVWYDLKATVNETGELEFQINDTVFGAFDPQPLSGGQVGLMVTDARARFDNVEITGNNIPNGGPGKPFDVAPKDKLTTTWGKLKMK